MAITTYAQLQTSVSGWLNRSDASALIPDFITLAEERVNRKLRVKEMETPLAATAITNNAIAVPANTVGVKTLWIEGYETSPLLPATYEYVLSRGSEGIPCNWAWQGSNLYFDGAGTVQGVLYRDIPALSNTNTTNWLLTAHPSAYLFGALAEAFNWARNDKERDRWDARFQQTLSEISGADMRDRFSSPLVVRAR